MLDGASAAAATAALSRRRKQSRPRQLASSVDSETPAADNHQRTSACLVFFGANRLSKVCFNQFLVYTFLFCRLTNTLRTKPTNQFAVSGFAFADWSVR